MDGLTISLVSASTALATALISPFVTLRVSRRQTYAAVVSTNRQKWIDELRSAASAFAGQAVVLDEVHGSFLKDGRLNFAESEALTNRFETLVITATRIQLLVDPRHPVHLDLLNLIDAMIETLSTVQSEIRSDRRIDEHVRLLVNLTRTAIREEWLLVKQIS